MSTPESEARGTGSGHNKAKPRRQPESEATGCDNTPPWAPGAGYCRRRAGPGGKPHFLGWVGAAQSPQPRQSEGVCLQGSFTFPWPTPHTDPDTQCTDPHPRRRPAGWRTQRGFHFTALHLRRDPTHPGATFHKFGPCFRTGRPKRCLVSTTSQHLVDRWWRFRQSPQFDEPLACAGSTGAGSLRGHQRLGTTHAHCGGVVQRWLQGLRDGVRGGGHAAGPTLPAGWSGHCRYVWARPCSPVAQPWSVWAAHSRARICPAQRTRIRAGALAVTSRRGPRVRECVGGEGEGGGGHSLL
jgi:hypothetical protein